VVTDSAPSVGVISRRHFYGTSFTTWSKPAWPCITGLDITSIRKLGLTMRSSIETSSRATVSCLLAGVPNVLLNGILVFLGEEPPPHPNSVLASHYPTAKIGDYGLAIVTGPTDPDNPRKYRRAGTPGYKAPVRLPSPSTTQPKLTYPRPGTRGYAQGERATVLDGG